MPVKVLSIKNFKSIRRLRLNCKKVNLLIGEPNTGKSNLLEAIGLLSHIGTRRQISAFVRFEVMTDLFYDRILDEDIRIDFDERALQINFQDGAFNGIYQIQKNEGKTQSSRVFRYNYQGGDGIGHQDFQVFKFYRFSKKRKFPNRMSEFLQPPDGDNLLAVILTRKKLRRLFMGFFRKFGYRLGFNPQEGRIEVLKEIEDIIFLLPYSLASETLQRLVFYLTAIHSNKEAIITFEEPEAHAFPFYTKYLAERIALDKNKNQYFITTHNPYFLTSILEKTISRDVAIFATYFKDYETKVRPLTKKQKEEILEMGSDVFFNIRKFLGN